MPRTADHLVLTHRIAAARVADGLPVWAETVDVSDLFHNDTLTFKQMRDAVVAQLKATRWFKQADEDESWGVHEIVAYHLAEAEDEVEFNGCWDELYDHADLDRVWIKTRA